MYRTLKLAACLMVLSCAAGVGAQPKPDFSGSWKLNREKSSAPGVTLPDPWTRTITHSGKSLELKSSQPRNSGAWKVGLEIGGREAAFEGDVTGAGLLRWDGVELVFEFKRQPAHGGIVLFQTERWGLSPDGKTLTARVISKTPHGEQHRTMVWERQ
jgi:hypothetical protein